MQYADLHSAHKLCTDNSMHNSTDHILLARHSNRTARCSKAQVILFASFEQQTVTSRIPPMRRLENRLSDNLTPNQDF